MRLNLRLYYPLTSLPSVVNPVKKTWWWSDEEAFNYLESFEIARKEIDSNKYSLSRDFETLKTEIDIFKEVGIKVNIDTLKRFRKIYHEDLSSLEREGLLADTNIERKLLSLLGSFPYDSKLPTPSTVGIEEVYKKIKQYHRKSIREQEEIKDWPNNVPLEKRRTLEIEQRRVLRQYYAWRLESSYLHIDKLMYNYSKITGLRTVRSLKQTLDLLENNLEFPKSKILRNFYLLSIVPKRLEDLFKNVPKIGETDLKTAAHAIPKILAKSSAQIKEIDDILNEYGIKDNLSSSHNRNQMFTYTAATVRQRLELIKNSNLAPFLEHPRICELLFYFRKVWTRYKDAESRGFKCCSLNTLTGSDAQYEKFVSEGVDRLYDASDITNCIAHALNTHKTKISKLIIRHPMRYFVPVAEVQLTLKTLLDAGFSKDVIAETVTILLYPQDKILEALDVISESQELKNLGMEKGFAPVTDTFASGSKNSDKRLPLCLYILEKPYNFTGDGATRLKDNVEKNLEEE